MTSPFTVPIRKPPAGGNQGSSQQGVAPPLDVPTQERGSRSSGSPTAEVAPAVDGRDERAGHPQRPWSVGVPRMERTVCPDCGHFHRKTLAGYLPWSKKRRPAKCRCCKKDYDAVYPKGPPDDEVD